MLKRITYIIASAVILLVFTNGVTKSNGPPGCFAGEPPGNKTCNNCHSGIINSGTALVDMQLDGAETNYIPGKVYTFTISIKKTGMQVAGFQFIALQNNNTSVSPGTITLTDAAKTQRVDQNNPHVHGSCGMLQKVWVEHTLAGTYSNPQGENVWSFQWQAPATDVGGITFYLAALEANNDSENDGDATYTRSVTTSVITGLSELENLETYSQAYYNIYQKSIVVSSEKQSLKKIEILSIQGERVFSKNLVPEESNNLQINTQHIANGLYLIVLHSENQSIVKKIIIH